MLHKLQQNFIAGLYNSDEAAAVLAEIRPGERLSAADQLAIYRASLRGGLTEALAEIYPVLRLLVGVEFFEAMVLRYIMTTPSRHYDLNDYGESLPGFIDGFPPAASLPYLADVARLEWAWHRAFYAANDKALTVAALAEIPATDYGDLCFRLPDSARLVSSPCPVHRIWEVAQDDDEDAGVSLDEGGVRLLVWRQGGIRRMDPLDDAEWQFLQGIQAGQGFGAICARLAAARPDVELMALLHTALQRGWLAGVEVGRPNNQAPK